MVMGRRPGVERSSWPITATDMMGLASQFMTAMVRVPFRKPWSGASSLPHNLAVAVTRETLRSFMGYSSSLPIAEWRSVEMVLDDLCQVIMPPLVRSADIVSQTDTVAGVPGIWYRPRNAKIRGTVLYLHGGGYVGTSPRMYGLFVSWLSRLTSCEVFVADLRLAPEFPFPADLEDAVLVLEGLLAGGVKPTRLFVAGDSSGGGLVSSLVYTMTSTRHHPIAGVILFSPELDLVLDEPSITQNADRDILPWNIPTAPYLHGRDPESGSVSAIDQDVSCWPPAFVSFGGDEMFRDSIRRFVAKLETAGVETVASEEPGMFHVFPILMPWAEASRRVYRGVADFVAARLDAAEKSEDDTAVTGQADQGA